jgi:hypothetical protein
MDGNVSALLVIPRGKALRAGRRSGAVGTALASRGRRRPTLSEMLRRIAGNIHRLAKIEAGLPGHGRVSAIPAAIGAVLNVASRNNIMRPSVRTAGVEEAVLLAAAVPLRPGMVEAVAVEAILRAAIADVNRFLDFPQPLRPPDRAGAAFFVADSWRESSRGPWHIRRWQ